MIVPSVWEEPYGNVVLEGMACGCVPIASDGGGMPEAIGHAGFTFKRNDVNDMVRVIESVLNNNNNTVDDARSNTKSHLDAHAADLVSKKYFKLIQSAAGQN